MPQIIPLRKHLETKKFIKAIVAGEPDTRKTSALASFPGKKLWVDRDRKSEALVVPINLGNDSRGGRIAHDDIDVFVPDRAKQILTLLDKLVEQGDDCQYANIVLDSFTTVIETELRAIAHKKAKAAANSNAQTVINSDGSRAKNKGQAKEARLVGGIPINSIEDYKAETGLIVDIIDRAHLIQANFFLICHVVVWTGEGLRGTSKTKRQFFTGGKKATALLPALFSEIWHFEKETSGFGEDAENKYWVHFQSTDEDIARTALGIQKPINFTNKSLYRLLKKYLDVKLAPPEQLANSTNSTQPQE